MPYPFIKPDDLNYRFVTDGEIAYKAYFEDYSFIFPAYPEFSGDIYAFNLEVFKGDVYSQPVDSKVAETVIAIFLDFFSSRRNVVIYICDTTDERQHLRKRKFDTWFWKYNDGSFIKEDGLAMIADVAIYASLIIHKEHPLLNQVIEAFRTENERANDK